MARRADYIPARGAIFIEWQRILKNYANSHREDWGTPESVFAEMNHLSDVYEQAYSIATNPESRTPATVKTKMEAEAALVAEIRKVVKAYITYNPVVTDADRENMGLPIHDTKPTPVSAPTEAPVVEIDFSHRQQHSVTVKNIAGRAKPANAHGFEVWSKTGTPAPVTDRDFLYAGFATRSPFTIRYELDEVGKIVYYRSHWVNAKNEPGPWSEIISATIA